MEVYQNNVVPGARGYTGLVNWIINLVANNSDRYIQIMIITESPKACDRCFNDKNNARSHVCFRLVLVHVLAILLVSDHIIEPC